MLRVQVTAILDKRKSETNIQQDLSNISNSLEQSKTNQIKLVGNLDVEKTLNNIKNSLNNVKLSISNIQVDTGMSSSKIQNDVQKIIKQGVNNASAKSSVKIPFNFDFKKIDDGKIKSELDKLVKEFSNGRYSLQNYKLFADNIVDDKTGEQIKKVTRILLTYGDSLEHVINRTLTLQNLKNSNSEKWVLGNEILSQNLAKQNKKSNQQQTTTKKSNTLNNQIQQFIDKTPIEQLNLEFEKVNGQTVTYQQALLNLQSVVKGTFDPTILAQHRAEFNRITSAFGVFNNKSVYDKNTDFIKSKNTLDEVKQHYRAMEGVSSVGIKGTKTANGEIQKFTVSVKKANGECKNFKYTLAELSDGTKFFRLANSTFDDSGILKLQNDIEATKAKAKEMLSALNNTSRGTVSNTQMYKDLLSLINTMKDTSDIDRFNNKFKELKALVNDIYSRSRTGSSLNPIQNLQDKLSNADVQLRNIQSSFSQLQARYANNTSSTFQSELTSVKSNIDNIVAEYNKLKNIDLLKITDSNKLLQTVDQMRTFINNMQSVISQMNAFKREASATQAQLNATAQSQNLVFDKKKLSNQILAWMNNNTKAAKAYGEQLNQLRSKIETVTNTKGLTTIRKEFAGIRAEASARGLLGNTFFTTLVNDIKKFSTWFGVGGAVARVIRTVKQMFTNVKELDTAMIELKKVTDEANDTYQEFLANSTIKAKELGVTITDLVKATSSFAKLGYSLEDSSKLGEVATMYANVGDEIESVDDAASSIISTIKAFDIDASDSMSIIDKINEVSNKESISAGGLGEALQRSAAALATANNDINQTLALITAGNLVNQDPSAVGTGLKTVSLRIRGAKAELEELGEETEDVVESTSKLQAEIKALTGVDILESDGNAFKSTYQILKEISEVWNDLSDLNQATVLEDLFGKRQANIGASILSNFDVAEKTLKESLNSEGSAEKEYKKWLESIEAKQAQFKASFEALSNSLISSDFVKGAVESGSKILDLITKINDGLGLIPILLSTISSVWLTKNNAGLFTKDNSGALHFFTQTKRNNIDIEANKITNAINRCSTSWDSLGASGQALTSQTEMMNNEFKDLDPTLTRGVAETGNFAAAQQQLQKNVNESKNSIKLFSGALTKLKGLASAIGTSLVNFGISMLISVVFSSIVKAVNSSSEAMEKVADKAEQLSEQSKALSDTQQQIVELRSKLDDVNTSENEAVSIREQLYEIQNDLIEQYGTEASKIDLVRDSVDSLNGSLQSLDTSKLEDWYLDDPNSASTAVKNIYGENSIKSWGINTGNETINISRNINGYDLGQIQHIFTSRIGGDNWDKHIEGSYAGDYTLEIGKSVKESGGTKKDLVDKYTDILNDLEQVLTKAQNEGRTDTEIVAIEDLISQISKAKNYWADDNYESDYATANKYAQYLVSQNRKQNTAYTASQKAETDYNNALASGSKEDVELAYRNYKLALDTVQGIIDGLGSTGNDGAIRNFLEGVVEGANADLSKDDFKLKFEADENGLKTSLQNAINNFGSGKAVNADEIINFNPYADVNKGTERANAFYEIQNAADNAGVSLETYVNWLVEVGIVQGEISDESNTLDFTPIIDMNTESMKALTEEIDNVQSSFDTIKGVITDYNTTGVLSIDNMQKLLALDSEYIKTLFDENGNLVLNEQAYQDLAKAKLENIKMDMLKNAIDNIKKITDEASAQEYLSQKINDTTEATEGYTEAILRTYVANGVTQGGKVKEAVEDIYETYLQYTTLVENTDTTFKGNTNATNAQTEALENQKTALEKVKEEQEAVKEALEDLTDEYEDSQSKINDLIDLTVDMLKQKYEDEKEIIEEQKDAYKDRVDALKESLEEEQEVYDRYQSLSEKKNDISTLQRQATSLQGNNSVEGKQRLAEIQSELAESTQDLYDTQYENSISDRQDALDQEYEHKEQLWDKEIERIEEVVSNERQLRIQAMNLIDTKSNEFYNNLWNYVYEYTTKSKFEFNNLWNEAYSALDKYNWGQLTCMQIMDLLEQNIYNTGLQIDVLEGHINDVSTAIDNVSTSIQSLTTALENATQAKINWDKVSEEETQNQAKSSLIEISLGGGKTYSTTGQSRLASSILIWRQWKQDYDNGQTDRTTYTTQDVYNAILKKYPEENQPNQYAKGTLSSKGGLSVVDEEGSELILSQPQKGRYANLNEGSVVFTKDQTENLWELSKLSDPPKKFMDAYNKFKSVYVKNGNHFFMNKSNENYLSDIRGNSSINTNSVHNNDNKTINVPIKVTVNNASGLNEKKLATEIKNDIFREFRRYGSWLG